MSSDVKEQEALNALKQVIDPEIGINIVDLGLVYDVRIDGANACVQMTLTTPGCPMHESIMAGVQRTLLSLPGIQEAEVDLVWDPPWHPAMISREAMETLSARKQQIW